MHSLRNIALAGALAASACGGGNKSTTVVYGADTVVAPMGNRVPAGSEFWVTLDAEIDDDSRPGAAFSARVAQSVIAPDGEVLIPEGARVVGHVEMVKDDAVVLTFDKLEADGTSQPIHASIVSTNVKQGGTHVSKRDVLIGAGVGAIIGGIVEGGTGLIVGGIVGAAGGTAISLGRNHESGGKLERGTGLEVRLEKPVRDIASMGGTGRYY